MMSERFAGLLNLPDVVQIEQQRKGNPNLDAIYLLSPEPYVVDCLLSDLERRRYNRTFLIWTSRACVNDLRGLTNGER